MVDVYLIIGVTLRILALLLLLAIIYFIHALKNIVYVGGWTQILTGFTVIVFVNIADFFLKFLDDAIRIPIENIITPLVFLLGAIVLFLGFYKFYIKCRTLSSAK